MIYLGQDSYHYDMTPKDQGYTVTLSSYMWGRKHIGIGAQWPNLSNVLLNHTVGWRICNTQILI